MRDTTSQIIEAALLVPAFGFLIPPVSSTPAPPDLFPGLAFSSLFFAGSLVLGAKRRAQPPWLAMAKFVAFVVFGWLVYQRLLLG